MSHPVYDFDLVQVCSGEILTVVGNYSGEYLRARLSFLPDPFGEHIINGKKFTKIGGKYISHTIPYSSKILDMPGEEHFVIRNEKIIERWDPRNSKINLNEASLDAFELLVRELGDLGIVSSKVGAAGSTALGTRSEKSDLDILIYGDFVKEVRDWVTRRNIKASPPFSREFVISKYLSYELMSSDSLWSSFLRRWKYIKLLDMEISLNFVDADVWHDDLLDLRVLEREVEAGGVIAQADRCMFAFCECEIATSTGNVGLLTPLYFYRGAFLEGDQITSRGTLVRARGSEAILIDGKGSWIRWK